MLFFPISPPEGSVYHFTGSLGISMRLSWGHRRASAYKEGKEGILGIVFWERSHGTRTTATIITPDRAK
jgi:hypothetical protein